MHWLTVGFWRFSLLYFLAFGDSASWAQTTGPKPIFWLQNRGAEVMLFDGPSESEIICGEIKPGERLRLLSLQDGFYKVQTNRGNCRNNIGYVHRSAGDLVALKSTASKPYPTPTIKSQTAQPAATASSDSSEERWQTTAHFYLAARAGATMGVTALEENAFIGGIELGFVPLKKKAFLLAVPISYASSSAMDIGDGILVDVALLTLAASPQYRLGLGESAWFLLARGDVGISMAFGSLSTSINNVSDYSLSLRPALGFGKQESESPWIYGVEAGLNVMPLGFGFIAMAADIIASVQYWF